jgi:hypothetical protein
MTHNHADNGTRIPMISLKGNRKKIREAGGGGENASNVRSTKDQTQVIIHKVEKI